MANIRRPMVMKFDNDVNRYVFERILIRISWKKKNTVNLYFTCRTFFIDTSTWLMDVIFRWNFVIQSIQFNLVSTGESSCRSVCISIHVFYHVVYFLVGWSRSKPNRCLYSFSSRKCWRFMLISYLLWCYYLLFNSAMCSELVHTDKAMCMQDTVTAKLLEILIFVRTRTVWTPHW
jgi:hypothetical protein